MWQTHTEIQIDVDSFVFHISCKLFKSILKPHNVTNKSQKADYYEWLRIFSPKYWDEPYFIRHQPQQSCGNAISELANQQQQRGVTPADAQNLQSKGDLFNLLPIRRYLPFERRGVNMWTTLRHKCHCRHVPDHIRKWLILTMFSQTCC